MQHTHDFDHIVSDAVEDYVRVNEDGPQARHDFIACAPCQRPLLDALGRLMEYL